MDKRVVIADDESIIRLDLKEILEDDGYLVVGEAARGDDALAMIKEHEPDLALLDVKMPGLDGIEVAERAEGLDDGRRPAHRLQPAHADRERARRRRRGLSRQAVSHRARSCPSSRRSSIPPRANRCSRATRPAPTTRSRRARSSSGPRRSSWPSGAWTSPRPSR